ncbi:MAG: biopolymer transporter ExbD [Fluviicola sp.]|nr:biopolymer transporter ExbD [Fluviicola sp.]
MNFGQKNKVKVGNGLTAISSVVLVMLIFFMVMAVASKKEDKPIAIESTENFEPSLTVVITKDNEYYILPGETAKDKRSFDEIKTLIGDKMIESQNKQLKIEGAQTAKYETIYNVAALAQKNNWQYRLDFTKEANPQ